VVPESHRDLATVASEKVPLRCGRLMSLPTLCISYCIIRTLIVSPTGQVLQLNTSATVVTMGNFAYVDGIEHMYHIIILQQHYNDFY